MEWFSPTDHMSPTITLPVCDNATLFLFICVLILFLPPDHTNPRFGFQPFLVLLLHHRSTLALLFCFLWFPFWYRQFTWVCLVWWLCAWWMLDTRSDGRWHRDFAWCPGSSMHFTCSTLRLKSLCWQVEFFFFFNIYIYCNLFVSEVPFECLFSKWCVFCKYVIMIPVLPV